MASGSKKVIIGALVGNGLIAVTKFVAAAITGSSAMASEGIHSLVDTGNQVLLLFGLRQARKPPDERFPFGYGKEVYFWSFVVAISIFAVGAGVSIYEGVQHLRHPKLPTNPLVNYIVLGLAMVFEGGAWWLAFREFNKTKGRLGYLAAVQRSKDPTLFVVLFEDSAAMLGLLFALCGVGLTHLTGNGLFDGAASVAIGVVLAATAAWLAYETKGLLIGEAANRVVIDDIKRIALTFEPINHVNEVLTLHMGPEFILVNASVDFDDDISADELEGVIAELSSQLKETHPKIKRVFVEAEPFVARRTGSHKKVEL